MIRFRQVRLLLLLALFSSLLARHSLSAQVNLAHQRPVISSGANWGAFKPGAATDSDPSTFVHPAADSGTLGFYYEVDLGRSSALERIVIRNRGDGCCPERLSRYRVEVRVVSPDSGDQAGPVVWSALIRGDGSNSGVSGADTITAAADPVGVFQGRFIRVINASGLGYSPQLAEIEAYGGPAPTIRRFAVDDDTLVAGAETLLRWELDGADSAVIEPGIGSVSPASGTAAIRPAASAVYTLRASNRSGQTEATVRVGVGVQLQAPRILEFLADNKGGLADEDGDTSDWIELWNPNEYRLDPGGYFLTDDSARLTRWELPHALLQPGERRVVFASGKDRRNSSGPWHTSFRLAASGAYLALIAPDGKRVVQQFPADFPATRNLVTPLPNVSYGLDVAGKAGWMRPPTPGEANGEVFPGVIPPLEFSVQRGFFEREFSLVIRSTVPGVTIRYTIDRRTPTATLGTVYAEPIPIAGTTVVRAAAFRQDWAPSPVETHTYLFPEQVIQSSVMRKSVATNALYAPQMRGALLEIPSISLVTGGVAVRNEEEIPASIEWLENGSRSNPQVNCGVQHYGGAFTDFAKKNFRLYFRQKYGAGKWSHPVFQGFEHGYGAADKFDQLELRSGSHDMEMRGFYLSNAFVDDTLRAMGHLNPHGRFVHVYLNGTYWGMFHLRERWGASMHESYLGGDASQYESINGNWNVGGWADPGTPYDGDGSAWTRIKQLRGNYKAVKPWLDVPQYIDYMLMWMFGGSEDEYRCVGPTVPGSGFKFYLNDADGWFCIPQYCAAGDRTVRGAPGRQAGDGPGSLFSTLFKEADPEYRTLLADRIHRALAGSGALTAAQNSARLQRRLSEVERPFLAESARWNYLTPAAWSSRRDSALKDWLPRRTAEVLGQFRAAGFYPRTDPPRFAPTGGALAKPGNWQLAGPSGATVYYTLDGSDPRLPGGAVSPAARSLASSGASAQFIAPGARWKWKTDATGLGSSDIVATHPAWGASNWKHPQFDDAAWSEGDAQLGYGEGDEKTVLPFGSANNKWITSYFRHAFNVSLPSPAARVRELKIRLKRDDGAIVYINGIEAARSSIPSGAATAATLADGPADDGQGFVELDADPNLIVPGRNVIAVELHQSSATTSDASFDLELNAAIDTQSTPGSLPLLDRNTLVRARARIGTEWSALAETFYQTDSTAAEPGEIVFSELLVSSGNDTKNEFIELRNLASRAMDLRGARFTDGIDFLFPDTIESVLAPGQRIVLVRDLFVFHQRYGPDARAFGIYFGSLQDQGENLTLVDAQGRLVAGLAYATTPPWPAVAGGFSLVLNRPALGAQNPAAWRRSAAAGGTPGGSDGAIFPGDSAPDADHDADGLSALWEHVLGTSDANPSDARSAVRYGFSEAGQFRLELSASRTVEDYSAAVDWSDDLEHWSPAERVDTHPDPSDDSRFIDAWTGPQSPATHRFFRLKIVKWAAAAP